MYTTSYEIDSFSPPFHKYMNFNNVTREQSKLLYKMTHKLISDLKRSIFNLANLDLDNLCLFKVIVSYFLKQADIIKNELFRSFMNVLHPDI